MSVSSLSYRYGGIRMAIQLTQEQFNRIYQEYAGRTLALRLLAR